MFDELKNKNNQPVLPIKIENTGNLVELVTLSQNNIFT